MESANDATDHAAYLTQRHHAERAHHSHADAAMYRGKLGPGGIVIYEAATPVHATDTLVIQEKLREALDHGELVLHYQPKLKLSSGQVTCVEALVRWQEPRTRAAAAGGVSYCRGALRPDRTPDGLGAAASTRRLHSLDSGRPRLDGRRQCLGAKPHVAGVHRQRRPDSARGGRATRPAPPGGRRDCVSVRCRAGQSSRRSARRPGHLDSHGPLRDGSHGPGPVLHHQRVEDQDRPDVPRRPAGQRAGSCHRAFAHRSRPQPRMRGHRTGCGVPGRRRRTERCGVRRRAGLPLAPSGSLDRSGPGVRRSRDTDRTTPADPPRRSARGSQRASR